MEMTERSIQACLTYNTDCLHKVTKLTKRPFCTLHLLFLLCVLIPYDAAETREGQCQLNLIFRLMHQVKKCIKVYLINSTQESILKVFSFFFWTFA